MKQYHELKPVYDENSEILILGSFPSVKSREKKFYYGHPQNRFWKIMENIYQVSLPDIESKKEFLLTHHLALWDVVASCDIRGSSDSSISNIELNDIKSLIDQTKIKKIFVNGKKAEQYYNKYIFMETKIPCIVLPSTSPANASYSLEKLTKIWKEQLSR